MSELLNDDERKKIEERLRYEHQVRKQLEEEDLQEQMRNEAFQNKIEEAAYYKYNLSSWKKSCFSSFLKVTFIFLVIMIGGYLFVAHDYKHAPLVFDANTPTLLGMGCVYAMLLCPAIIAFFVAPCFRFIIAVAVLICTIALASKLEPFIKKFSDTQQMIGVFVVYFVIYLIALFLSLPAKDFKKPKDNSIIINN